MTNYRDFEKKGQFPNEVIMAAEQRERVHVQKETEGRLSIDLCAYISIYGEITISFFTLLCQN